jgi:DNA polymerase II large subunit
MSDCSEQMKMYFSSLNEKINECYNLANKARSRGYDPEKNVSVALAKDMSERVEGLVSVVAPQIKGSGVSERIKELEKIYGSQDWRVALHIALEIAQEKYCKFKDKKEAMEIGIRAGFCYITVGVVASPLEGFLRLEFKKRADGRDYLSAFYAGPVRSAGGTAGSVSLIIIDYVRKNMGYDLYDPTDDEIKRTYSELSHYHERVTNLQYFPSEQEAEFMTRNLPVQIDGDPTEKIEVPNYRYLPRIKSNIIRGGFCLVMAECICSKAKKIWARMSKWADSEGMGHWKFLEDFVILQTNLRAKTKGDVKKESLVVPDNSYLKDLVAGRPILGHPMRSGAFRVRYGRTRVSGFSTNAIHPMSMLVLDGFVAIGTQLKGERPGKGCGIAICDSIEPPIVKLKDGSVMFLMNLDEYKLIKQEIEEILFVGDILINYGDFLDRGHKLFTPGYCEEWWALELEKSLVGSLECFSDLIRDPIHTYISCDEAIKISREKNIPLHPKYTYHWSDICVGDVLSLLDWISYSTIQDDKIILPLIYNYRTDLSDNNPKRVLELLGIPHKVVNKEFVIVEGDWCCGLKVSLGFYSKKFDYSFVNDISKDVSVSDNGLVFVNKLSEVFLRDKSGVYVGFRMGRPEKGKIRKMTGSPQVMFPIGSEGGRLRCFQAALDKGKVTAQFPLFWCSTCNLRTIYPVCHKCGSKSEQKYYCKQCGEIGEPCDHNPLLFSEMELPIKEYFNSALALLSTRNYPDLIKGVRGTSNKDHIPEHLIKGILRSIHGLYVNKDGTTRFDMTELPITHFKPKEIGTPINRLIGLGYTKDIHGNDLINDNQILEIKCQDVILPMCLGASEDGADIILIRVAKFIDDLLVKFYKCNPYYNVKTRDDLVGHLVVGLSPHTSAGIVSRIIGFSSTQALIAHPLLHSIMRRDCLYYNTFLPLQIDDEWKIMKIGDLVEILNPMKNVDLFGTKAIKVNGYKTYYQGNKDIIDFTKHTKSEILNINTECGRTIKVTKAHKFYTKKGLQNACELKIGDKLIIPYKIFIDSKKVDNLDLLDLNVRGLMLRNCKKFILNFITKYGGKNKIRNKLGVSKKSLDNYLSMDSFPIKFVKIFLNLLDLSLSDLPLNTKVSLTGDKISLPRFIKLDKDTLWLIGFYVAEGYSRRNKRLNQIEFAVQEKHLRSKVINIINQKFGLKPTLSTNEGYVFSSGLFYELLLYLQCGMNAYEKRVPSKFLSLPLNNLKYFLRGYFDGSGSVSLDDCRITCDNVSEGLLQDLEFILKRYDIFSKFDYYKKKSGSIVAKFYVKNGRKVPKFECTKLIIESNFCNDFYNKIGFSLRRKQDILKEIQKCRLYSMNIEFDEENVYSRIVSIDKFGEEISYCLNVDGHKILPNGILTKQCDGDEAGVMLLLDTLLNFSPKLLSDHRGAKQDEPLVLTSTLIPSEVDDMVFNMDVCWKYSLEFYEACMQYKSPSDVPIDILKKRLFTVGQYEGYGFTHDTDDFNAAVTCSSYKNIPTMEEKVLGQMLLADKLRCVDADDVARLVIERHFLRDLKGNLRKFSQQEFRCVKCNEKFRRSPLKGVCTECNSKILFTISEGSIVKYLQPCLTLLERYELPHYLRQSIELLQQRIDTLFGKEPDVQEDLDKWLAS